MATGSTEIFYALMVLPAFIIFHGFVASGQHNSSSSRRYFVLSSTSASFSASCSLLTVSTTRAFYVVPVRALFALLFSSHRRHFSLWHADDACATDAVAVGL